MIDKLYINNWYTDGGRHIQASNFYTITLYIHSWVFKGKSCDIKLTTHHFCVHFVTFTKIYSHQLCTFSRSSHFHLPEHPSVASLPSPYQPLLYFLSLWAYLFHLFHTNVTTQYMTIRAWIHFSAYYPSASSMYLHETVDNMTFIKIPVTPAIRYTYSKYPSASERQEPLRCIWIPRYYSNHSL